MEILRLATFSAKLSWNESKGENCGENDHKLQSQSPMANRGVYAEKMGMMLQNIGRIEMFELDASPENRDPISPSHAMKWANWRETRASLVHLVAFFVHLELQNSRERKTCVLKSPVVDFDNLWHKKHRRSCFETQTDIWLKSKRDIHAFIVSHRKWGNFCCVVNVENRPGPRRV